MEYKYLDDEIIHYEKQMLGMRFLYNTILGRSLLKVITRPIVSKSMGAYLNSPVSKIRIKRFVKKHSIDMSKYKEKRYKSFNDFFIRELKETNFDSQSSDFVSTANSKISCYNISKDLVINVKNSFYTIDELVRDEKISEEYQNGICIVYRLSPSDYHRYIFCDNGTQEYIGTIKGKLHTVNPIVYNKYKVFAENYREINQLNTDNFGKIIQIEVGALLVGKIKNKSIDKFSKYDEKGYFEFGGSTIIQLVKKDCITINKQIMKNSKNNIETFVNIGEIIGKKK